MNQTSGHSFHVPNEHSLDKSELLEERIKLAIDATGIGTWEFDPVERTAYYDDQCKKLFGFSTAKEFKYDDFLNSIDDRYKVQREKILSLALAGDNEGKYETQYQIRTRDENKERWISSKGRVYFDSSGKAIRLIGTMLDITKEKAGEQILRKNEERLQLLVDERTASLLEANKQLQESNHNLSEFAYVASHDLQEPLRKINTFSQLLKERDYGEDTAEVKSSLNRITEASQRMSRLIEDLLNYARLLNMEEALEPTPLNDILETVVNDFELEISKAKAIIEIGELPVIQAIPIRMSQLFHNLFSNSLKFMPGDRQPKISVSSTRLPEEDKLKLGLLSAKKNYFQILFTDNGIGFSPQYAEKIFNLFQRLNGRSEYSGTGIGLTICRKIVSNHQGLIFADSKEGEGSTFRIILPERILA